MSQTQFVNDVMTMNCALRPLIFYLGSLLRSRILFYLIKCAALEFVLEIA